MMQISDDEDEDEEDTESSEDDVDSANDVEFNNPVALVTLVEGTYISISELTQYCFLVYQFRRQPQPLLQTSRSRLSLPVVVEIVSARKSVDLPLANRKMTKLPASVVEIESSLNFVI
jgi:hypothetical protein